MKNLLLLCVILLGITSCKKEPVPLPPTTTVPAANTYHTITVSSNPSHDVLVDSIVYLNTTTNFKQTITSITPIVYTCDGITTNEHNLNLTTDYLSGDGCTITVYFTPAQGYKIFSILLLKNGEDECEGAGGNGGVLSTFADTYTITKNL